MVSQVGALPRLWDDRYLKAAGVRIDHRQADSLDADRPFVDKQTGELCREPDNHLVESIGLRDLLNRSDRIDVPGYDVSP